MNRIISRTLGNAAFWAVLVLGPQLAKADLFDWSFTAVPTDISGLPGTTIGWGYKIVNLDQDFWLSPTSLDADLFQNATPLSLFDFPILPPGGSVFEPFDPANFIGLYQQTWDPTAPFGFVNSGTFIVTADFYIGDPLAGGVLLDQGTQRSSLYSATVGNTVPEPGLFVLLGAGLTIGALFLNLKKRRRAHL